MTRKFDILLRLKGKRLIILHIGNEGGFVDGGALVSESNKSNGSTKK